MSLAVTAQQIPQTPRPRSHRPVSTMRTETAAVYRRRRVFAASIVIAVSSVVAMVGAGVLAGPGGVTASASGTGPAGGGQTIQEPSRATVVVMPGDTMWSIAADHRGDIDHARYLDALISYNGGASIEAGQVLILP